MRFVHKFTCMIRLRILLLILLLPTLISAKKKGSYYARFGTDAFWQKLVLDSSRAAPQISQGDTAIIVASNREPAPGQLRFMSEMRGDGAVRYFIAYSKAGRWYVQPQPSLRHALRALPQRDKDW